jgi:hypothetical protein
MNDSEPTAKPEQKAGCLIRAFLIALPVGLGFMVPLSLWIYYQKKHQPVAATSQYASMLRKDLNVDDFARYARILSSDIGERSLTKPENLDAAASFIDSTMGYDNMGYAVQRQSFDAQGGPAVNLVAELPGNKAPNDVVLVFASYAETDARAVAALMCVAHAFAGTQPSKTVQFAAVVSGADALVRLRQKLSDENKTVSAVIAVMSEATTVQDKTQGTAGAKQFQMTKSDDPATVLSKLSELKQSIETSANAP